MSTGSAKPSLSIVVPDRSWADLVLPTQVTGQLKALCSAAENGPIVSPCALFCGPPGTGKTLAAEVIASELQRPLTRVDLAAAASKYVGETEKSLDAVFSQAERQGTVLLLEEADALFGGGAKQSERVSGLRDAAILVLSRIQARRELTIVTARRCQDLDRAFTRRFAHVVEFPLPDAAERSEIWRRHLTSSAATVDVNLDVLAKTPLSGGQIHAAASAATVAASRRGEAVSGNGLAEAVRHVQVASGKG